MKMRRFIFSTRGIYVMALQLLILWLKHLSGSGVSLPLYLGLVGIVLASQVLRTWAAGFVGTTARGRETHANVLLTAGPYAYVRNPMYLGILITTTALAAMSGLWYAPLIAWAAFVFVYSHVIPHEEAFLRQRFGDRYAAYVQSVPRLLPTFHAYADRAGVFRLRDGLLNEVASWLTLPLLCYLYWRL